MVKEVNMKTTLCQLCCRNNINTSHKPFVTQETCWH